MRLLSNITAGICLLSLIIACNPKDQSASDMTTKDKPSTADVHSFAKPDEAVITNMNLELVADFGFKVLTGTVTYDIRVNEGANEIVLDTRELEIIRVSVDGELVNFTLGDEEPWLGRPLTIPVTSASKKLEIVYATKPESAALQWLDPSQTAGKKHPYLFTQGQAILTRTWIPIQDSPGIRLSYTAKVKVPVELMAVMSAVNPQERSADGVYTFTMDKPIPAYLIALSVGDLAFRPLGPRTGVYTEPGMIEKVAAEFEDLEKMVAAAEELYGPYRWGRYDIIVLPPSFPFGGMENPCLTFATPTIIAGDKSLTALVAHELAHSWSGNLVTNATWNDFWLNEGFTVYFENRIMEALYGRDYSDMLANLGYQDLIETVEELQPEDTHLYLHLADRDPDEGMTDIAYEKGAHFLRVIEDAVGRPAFDAFLRKYFDEHAFQSMTTVKFLEYLDRELLTPENAQVNIDEWVYGPGIPSNCPVASAARFKAVEEVTLQFLQGAAAKTLPTQSWTTHEWLHFIRALPDALTEAKMRDLDDTFHLTQSGNSEIQAAWYRLAIQQGYGRDIIPSIRKFLVETGRRKFLMPLYTALMQKGMQEEARDIFREAKPNYHSVSANSVEALLNK